jgi:hypothetical protein
MNHQINACLCWLAHLAANIKDPYTYRRYQSFSLELHPLACPPPKGYRYPSDRSEPFVYIGGMELQLDSVTNFEYFLTCQIMLDGFYSDDEKYFFRKIIIEQPKGKQYPPIYFYEIQVGGQLFMVGGKTVSGSNELRRLDDLFDSMKWVYKTEIFELTIPFSQIHQHFLSLKEKVRAYEKQLAAELEEMPPEYYYQESRAGW